VDILKIGYVVVESNEYWIEVPNLSPQAISVLNKISAELSANAIVGVGQT
jgi:2-keto-3-deoxy-6-phosphogluconate aldolase|tara:strand:- start:189 stop:338 length:150 start_codon:yes stop_codon:yes gene_type:complete